MSVKIKGTFLKDKKVQLLHEESGAQIITDAPKDNGGEGNNFSPTDLVAAAFGSCVLTTILLVAERDGLDMSGSRFSVEKHMSASPRRIAELPLVVYLPAELTSEQRAKYERVGRTCPVHHSLHPDVKAKIIFVYDVS